MEGGCTLAGTSDVDCGAQLMRSYCGALAFLAIAFPYWLTTDPTLSLAVDRRIRARACSPVV